jgi:hypothetical protein
MKGDAMPFTDRALRALGDYVVAYSYIEGRLSAILARLIESPHPYVGHAIVTKLSTRNCIELLESMMHSRDPERAEEHGAIIKQIRFAEDERNRLLHSFWWDAATDPQDVLVRVKNRAPRHNSPTIATMSEIPVQWLEQRVIELRALADEMLEWAAPLP